MDEAVFEKKLNELVKEMTDVPAPQRDKLITLVRQTSKCHKQLKKNVTCLQDSLDYLRVSVKYLIFDLEATRRENAELRRMLKDDKA